MFINNKKNSLILDSLSKSLPDDRPITSIQIIENIDKCPSGFYVINKTYDQDQDADLWRDSGSFLKKKTLRYLCLSKTEGLPNFVLQELAVLNEKSLPPEGYSLLNKTADSEQKAWRKKQICYKLFNRTNTKSAITDIIICSRLKKAPAGFTLAGEINGVTVCYKMGNVHDAQMGQGQGIANVNKPPERPPKLPTTAAAYPSLTDDGDYEILNPNAIPGYRPPPPPPVAQRPPHAALQHQTSTLTSHAGLLEGVPFILSPRLAATSRNTEKPQYPVIKTRSRAVVLKDYNYDFRLERQSVMN